MRSIDPEIDIGQGRWAFSTTTTSLGVSTITLQEVRIDDLVIENVEAIVYDLPLDLSVETILGISFLQKFKTTIDYKGNVLRLEIIEPRKSSTASNTDFTS